eukprot:m.34758 g.34758  ORF g.34758 m.34758 type:complete len:100 (+) comp11196_c1_seq1:178-477(+)
METLAAALCLALAHLPQVLAQGPTPYTGSIKGSTSYGILIAVVIMLVFFVAIVLCVVLVYYVRRFFRNRMKSRVRDNDNSTSSLSRGTARVNYQQHDML